MTAILRNVAKTFTFEEQRIEINEIAQDLYNLSLEEDKDIELGDFNVTVGTASGGGYLTYTVTGTYPNDTGEFLYVPPDLSNFWIEDTAKIANWDEAWGWGDHSTEGYLKNINGLSINELQDVTITSVQPDQFLRYDNGKWINTGDLKLSITKNNAGTPDLSVTGTVFTYTPPDLSSFASKVTTDDTAPSTPYDGQLWWKSDEGNLKIYYEDVDSSQWVDAVPAGIQLTDLSILVNPAASVSSLTYDNTNGKFTYTPSSGGGGGGNVQSDWTETDNTDDAFIKNKPSLPTNIGDLDNVDTSSLTDGYVLTYIAAGNGTWEPRAASSATSQVQADWNQLTTTAVDFIKNKPSIPLAQVQCDWNATAPSGGLAVILNKPTIPAAQIQSDWTQATTTAKDYIKNKPTVVSTLQALTDTDIPTDPANITNGHVLKWNSTTSKWGPSQDLQGSSSGGIQLDDISVVKPNPTAAGSGDVTYDNASGEFTYTPPALNFLTAETDTLDSVTSRSSGNTTTNSITVGGNGSSGGITLADGNIGVRTGTGNVAAIDLYCEVGNLHKVSIKAPPHSIFSGNVNFQLPPNNGTNGYVLSTDGNGNTSWVAQSGGGGGGNSSSDPIGTVVAWSGAGNNLPSGYQLCDGATPVTTELQTITGGVVPDLRDRFVVGAGSTYSENDTGGSKDAVVVSHEHTTNIDGGHVIPGNGGSTYSYGGAGTYASTVFNMDPAGVSGIDKNLPPYYSLCYIIKHSATAGSGEANVQANWTQTDTQHDSYIQNKPSIVTTAFTGTTVGLVPSSTSGETTKYLKSDGTWSIPSDTNTTYSNFNTLNAGLTPVSPGGSTKYLRADGNWETPPDTNTTYNVTTSAAAGLAPQLPASPTTKYLRDDGTWQTPPDNNTTYGVFIGTTVGLVPSSTSGETTKYLRSDGTWQTITDTDTTYSTFTDSVSGLVPASGGGTTKYLRADGTWQTVTSGGSDGNDYVTNLSLSGTTLTASFGNTSLNQTVNLASINTDTNTDTTYEIKALANNNDFNIQIDASGSGTDSSVRFEEGNNITLDVINSGHIKISATDTNTDTTYNVVSTSAPGLAPQLPGSSTGKYLKDDGSWDTPPDTDTDTNTNYYANSFQYNSSTNVLSIGYAGNSSLDTTVTINPSSSGGGASYLNELTDVTTGTVSDGDVLRYSGTAMQWQASSPSVPSGSVMLFAQSSAPSGWTKSTSHNNKALRVVSGSGGGSGGSVGFTSAFQNHNVSISGSDTVSISISGDCTGSQVMYRNTTQAFLTTDQMPSHQHDYDVPRGTTGSSYGFQDTATGTSSGLQKVASTGGSNYHTHAIIMYYINGSNFSFSGSDSWSDTVSISGSDSVNTAVQYVDVIICTKG